VDLRDGVTSVAEASAESGTGGVVVSQPLRPPVRARIARPPPRAILANAEAFDVLPRTPAPRHARLAA
jgi:hypothetical protein